MRRVKHYMYMAMVEGLFAMRAVGELSPKTEAEIADVHNKLWQELTPYEREQLEGDHGLIEQAKRKWASVPRA